MTTPLERMDLTGVPCPQNAARALMALEFMDPGDQLELLLDDGEPIQNVPDALELEGHGVLQRERHSEGWRVLIERGIE